METFAEFMDRLLKVFPDAEVEQGMNGELIVYPGLRETPEGITKTA